MAYTLSPEQQIVAGNISDRKASNTKYYDISTAMSAITSALISRLEKGQSVLLQIPNDHPQRAFILNHLKQVGLSSLAIDIGDTSPIPETDLINLRSSLKKKADSQPIVDYLKYQHKLAYSINKVAASFESLDSKILSDVKFSTFAEAIIYADNPLPLQSKPFSLGIEDALNYSSSEYYQLKKSIAEASKIYQAEYELYDRLALYEEAIWQKDDQEKGEILTEINLIIQNAEAINTCFNEIYEDLINRHCQDQNDKIQDLLNVLSESEIDCKIIEIRNEEQSKNEKFNFSIFGKKNNKKNTNPYSVLYQDILVRLTTISSQLAAAHQTNDIDSLNSEGFLTMTTMITDSIATYKQQIREEADNTIFRINRNNTTVPAISQIDAEYTALKNDMQGLGVFNTKMSTNTLSFSMQRKESKELLDYLYDCYALFNTDNGYAQWKSFYCKTDDSFRQILSLLKKHPLEQWNVIFDQWYYKSILSSKSKNINIDEDLLQIITEQIMDSQRLRIGALLSKIESKRHEACETLKSTSKELYNTLFKKKQIPSSSWHDLILMSKPFLTSFFPIHITSQSRALSGYDCTLRFSDIEQGANDAHYMSKISPDDIDNGTAADTSYLYLNAYNYTAPIRELPTSDKLKAAKKLSKFILSLNQSVKIYQIRDANIISLLPRRDTAMLEEAIQSLNYKAMDTDDMLYDRLTESILFTERSPYLIIKNNLINPEISDHLTWQLAVISHFRSAGYTIQSINTMDQLENNQHVFAQLRDQLGGHRATNTPLTADNVVEHESIPS